jgi:putative membrane protein
MDVSRTLLFLALAGASSAALAADAERTPPAASVFVNKAALDGMTEVEAAKIALAKSQDPAIRSFAERMVKDHGKAGAELETIAKAKGLNAPKKLDTEHQAMLDSLKAKSGQEFDHAYAEHMNMDHSKAIALFESATKSSDAELAGFAEKTLPTLRDHKQLAQKLPGN